MEKKQMIQEEEKLNQQTIEDPVDQVTVVTGLT